ncbi:MAG: ParB/RepB/Spo0J family partition protein [Bacillota bacterium]|nr:ParB/RepB/Spo0J family partition protein [Bacillota bacterium]
MNRKGGLGKGLGALIPDVDVEAEHEAVTKIPLNSIRANEEQPRKSFDNEKIAQLAESIREHGIIQPLILKKEDSNYIIIAGERRWRAAKSIGLKEVPAVIMEVTDKELLEISLIENIQREDLNPIEEAIAYEKLIHDFQLTQEELAKRICKSRTAIANCLRLLNLDKRVQEYLIDGVISEGHGRALLGVQDKEIQYSIAQTIIDEDLSVRQIEAMVKELGKEKSKREKDTQQQENIYMTDIKERLENFFGTKVLLKNKSNKGKIEIEYYSDNDLQRILDILKL